MVDWDSLEGGVVWTESHECVECGVDEWVMVE